MTHKALSYRPEIDGMRTLAVLAVMVFHLNHAWLQGGFLGVDVFFVISGYLITAIIGGQMQEGTFSFPGFWKRRIRRLYPALIVVVAAAMLVGTFILVQPERGELPRQALAAIFSFQNIYLWDTTSGYWGTSAENILLLHTWSLSLEEQFYLIFPLILFPLMRWGRRWTLPAMAGLFLASFAWCVYATPEWRNASFYLLPARMWELLCGSLLALYHLRKGGGRSSNVFAPWLQLAGVALIGGSFLLIANDERFPGHLPLFPCAGALLILAFGNASGPVSRLLSLKPVVYVGKISYSLYLWHWVVIVSARYISLEANTGWILLTTFLLAMASYHWVETPFRYGLKRQRLVLPLAGGAVAACALPILMLPSSPLLTDLGNINTKAARDVGRKFEAKKAMRKGDAGVWVNEDDKIDIYVMGSSHARVWCPAIADYASEHGLSMVSTSVSSTGILALDGRSNAWGPPDGLELHRQRIGRLQKERPTLVFIAGRWSVETRTSPEFFKIMTDQIRMISQYAGHVIVLGEVPGVAMPPVYHRAFHKFVVASALSDELDHVHPLEMALEANERVRKEIEAMHLPNVIYIDPAGAFLDKEGYLSIYDEDRILFLDDNHVTSAGAHFGFKRILEEPFDRCLKASWTK